MDTQKQRELERAVVWVSKLAAIKEEDRETEIAALQLQLCVVQEEKEVILKILEPQNVSTDISNSLLCACTKLQTSLARETALVGALEIAAKAISQSNDTASILEFAGSIVCMISDHRSEKEEFDGYAS